MAEQEEPARPCICLVIRLVRVLTLRALREVMDELDRQLARLDQEIAVLLADDSGYRAIQKIGGIGPVLAAVFVAEIGDVTRFPTPKQLSSWAGLTPRHCESDVEVVQAI